MCILRFASKVIPKHLRPALGKREIRRSLKTTNHSYAVRQARKFAVIIEDLFQLGGREKDHFENYFKKWINNFPHNVMRLPDNIGYPEKHKIAFCPPIATITKEPLGGREYIRQTPDDDEKCRALGNHIMGDELYVTGGSHMG